MFRLLHLVSFTVCIIAVCGYIKVKPDFLNTCMKKSKDFEKCSTKAVQALFDHIANGYPEVGLAPTDPLKISTIQITQGGDGPVSVNASLKNVTVVGFGKTKVLSNIVNPRNYDWTTKLHLDSMKINGKYSLFGRILLLPLRGHGECWFDASDISITLYTDVDLYQRDGFNFYNVTGTHVKFNFNGLKLHMGNLFNGVKSLEDTTNQYLNANWRPVADSLNPVLAQTIEEIILHLLQKIFHNTPADFWVKDIAEPVD